MSIHFSYDGFDIGDHLGDAARNIEGTIGKVIQDTSGYPPSGPFYHDGVWAGFSAAATGANASPGCRPVVFRLSLSVPTSYEFRTASISVFMGISY